MKTIIKDLKKGDKFTFNGILYTVRRRWIFTAKDDRPLIAIDQKGERHDFYFEDLEVLKVL